ncbi:MAG: DUF1919 domain-containing protein [Prevotella sp.]|nr:DUF1919 domain-containing protein [Prevotella sp.]
MSPTVGTYFYADDYIKFISNLQYYLSCDLTFISHGDSKYADILSLKKQESAPIGCLDDVEIVFLHYHSEEEAREKWERRVKRANTDNLIVKFSEQNLCEYSHLKEFDAMPYEKKILFTKCDYPEFGCAIKLPFYSKCISLLSDIHEYRFVMKKIMDVIN